jgi:hypothetical protein
MLLAINDIFWLSGWLFLSFVGLVWFADKSLGGTPSGAH